MEHTVEAYLQRVPTEKLVRFLNDYQQGIITNGKNNINQPFLLNLFAKANVHIILTIKLIIGTNINKHNNPLPIPASNKVYCP